MPKLYDTVRCRILRKPTLLENLGSLSFFELQTDFTPQQSDTVMRDLAERLQSYFDSRNISIKSTYGQDGRLINMQLTSKDGVVCGDLRYVPPDVQNGWLGFDGAIVAEIEFRSISLDDKQEYLGLVNVLKMQKLPLEPKTIKFSLNKPLSRLVHE